MKPITTVAIATFLILFAGTGRAQTGGAWVGQRVITRYGTMLQVGPRVVDDEDRRRSRSTGREHRSLRVYCVGKTQGPWAWLVAEDGAASGWARIEGILPYDRAINDLTARIRALPTSGSYLQRGAAWARKGEYDLAIADFNEAIRLDPSRAEIAYNNRGAAWADRGHPDRAIADFSEAIRLDPDYAAAYRNRGHARLALNDVDEAIADFSESIRLDPSSVLSYAERGLARHAGRDYDRALADFTEAIRLAPRFAWVYTSRGNTYYERGEYDRAIADHTRAIELGPKNPLTLWRRAKNWERTHEYGKALGDLDAALAIDPRHGDAWNSRAWIRATCPDAAFRDGKAAVTCATRACELTGWSNAILVDTLAAACAEAGDFAGAVNWEEKAIELKKDEGSTAEFRDRLKLYQERRPYRAEAEATRHARLLSRESPGYFAVCE